MTIKRLAKAIAASRKHASTIHDIKRESTNPYWILIHNEDLGLMLEARGANLKLFDELSIEQRQKHTFVTWGSCFTND